MTQLSQPRTELDHYRDECARLGDQLDAVRAITNIGEPDWRARCADAADAIRSLLQLAADRPGSHEAPHVEALEGELRDILHVVQGDGPEPEGITGRVGYEPPTIEAEGDL